VRQSDRTGVTASITVAHQVGSSGRARRLFESVVRAAAFVALAAVTGAMAVGAVAVLWFHLAIHPILSGSMRPTFAPGWLIVTRPIPVSHVKTGDILLFQPPGMHDSFAHRVIGLEGTPDHPIILTKGDANAVADPWKAQLQGRAAYQVVAQIPKLGWLLVGGALRIRALLIGLAGLVIAVGGARSLLRNSS
jgi:signal peptidase